MSKIRLLFAGDFCSKPSTSFITPSEELKSLLTSCNCRIVNFEVPLKPDIQLPERKDERYFQNDDAPKFLRNLGFDLFSIANNHAFDWGIEGFKKTKEALGDSSFGAGTYEEAYTVKVKEINGLKIGFLALSYTWPMQNMDKGEGWGCAYLNDLKVNHVIIDAKKKLDYLFVLPHDGIEYVDAPMPETIAKYRDFIDYGADGVIGSHPHCPQGWEEYKGKPIFYSLGNFFFNSKKDTSYQASNRPHWYEGRCVVVTIENGQITYEVINTRNINNIAIEIDHGEESVRHNKYVCGLLTNRQAYDDYMLPIMQKHVKFYLSKMESLFQPRTVKRALKVLGDCLVGCNKNKEDLSKNKDLLYFFRNDLRRAQILRFLLGK